MIAALMLAALPLAEAQVDGLGCVTGRRRERGLDLA